MYVTPPITGIPKVKDRLKPLLYTRFVVYTFVSEVDWYSNPISLKSPFKKIRYPIPKKIQKSNISQLFYFNPIS